MDSSHAPVHGLDSATALLLALAPNLSDALLQARDRSRAKHGVSRIRDRSRDEGLTGRLDLSEPRLANLAGDGAARPAAEGEVVVPGGPCAWLVWNER